MSDFQRIKIQYVDVDTFNSLLSYAKEYKGLIFSMPEKDVPIKGNAYISDKLTQTFLVMRYEGRVQTWGFRKDGEKVMQSISGLDAYIELARDYARTAGHKIPVFEDPMQFGSARAILRYRKDYLRTRVNAISYDENSAYAFAMCQDMPDTRELAGRDRAPKRYEIGFINAEDYFPGMEKWESAKGTSLQLVEPEDGVKATWIFNRMPSPFIPFANRHYNRKRDATDESVRKRSKEMLNYSVGYLQRTNPFLRAAIIGHANRKIEKLLDDNSIYCNTDSIISLRERDDLVVGKELGQFKIDHKGQFAFNGYNYQWDLKKPAYRGIPKTWFPDGWDILKDSTPTFGNIYRFNKVEVQIEKEQYFEEESKWFCRS